MNHEQYLTLDLIARLAGRFGPSSRVAKELPGWLEYLTEIECPERPRTRPGAVCREKIRQISRNLVAKSAGGEGDILNRNCAILGAHFGLTEVEVGILTFVGHNKVFDGFEHVVDDALDTKEVTVPLPLSWFCKAAEPEIRAALRPSGRLILSGLVQRNRPGRHNRMPFDLSDRLLAARLADVTGVSDLIGLMFPVAMAPEAEWQDFEGLGKDAGIMRDLIARAIVTRAKGVRVASLMPFLRRGSFAPSPAWCPFGMPDLLFAEPASLHRRSLRSESRPSANRGRFRGAGQWRHQMV